MPCAESTAALVEHVLRSAALSDALYHPQRMPLRASPYPDRYSDVEWSRAWAQASDSLCPAPAPAPCCAVLC